VLGGTRFRSASPETPFTLTAIEYYDSDGKNVRGRVGTNSIVRWHAETPIHLPVVETVMIPSEATQGISFRSTARVLYEETDTPPNRP